MVGIDDHEITGLDVVTAAPLFDTHKGPVIGIFDEYSHLGKGRSIHAPGQKEWFNCKVDDRSKVVGGAQRIETLMDMCFLFLLNLLWFTCTPSRSLLMMSFSNIPMSSSHHPTFGMLLFWTTALQLSFLRKSTKMPMILCSKIPC